jgi:excisionase family DNA binding protein
LAPKLYTTSEARAVLRVGKTRMYALLTSGELPSFFEGSHRRITEEALQGYLRKRMALAA